MRGKGAAARGKVAVARGKGTAARGKGAAAWGEGSGRAGEGGGRAGEGGTREGAGGGRAGGRRKRQMLVSLCTQARVCPFLQNSFGRCYVDITGDQVHPIEVGRTWSGIARDGVGWGGGCACRGAHQGRGCAGLGGGGARRDRGCRCRGGWGAPGRSGRTPGRRGRALGQSTFHYRRRGSGIPTPLKSTIPLLHIARHGADSAWICPLRAPRHCLARSRGRYAVCVPCS